MDPTRFADEFRGRRVYGLSPRSFDGLRAVGDTQTHRWNESTRRAQTSGSSFVASLVHGNLLAAPEPYLLIFTALPPPGPSVERLLAQEGERDGVAVNVGTAKPFEFQGTVDDISKTFVGIRSGYAWSSATEVAGHAVTAVGIRWPFENLELVHVTDISPYIEGRAELMEWLRAHPPGRPPGPFGEA